MTRCLPELSSWLDGIYDATVVTRALNPITAAAQSSRFPVFVAGLFLGAVALLACSEEVATDYTSAHRDAFLTACASPLEDPRLLGDVCVCVYDRLESEISFTRFLAISETFAIGDGALGPAPMPDELTEAVADCVVSEADL